MAYHKLPQKEELINLYKTMSLSEIAKKYRVTPRAVSTKLKRAGAEIRSLSEGQNLKANHITLTDDIKELIEGNLLADGSINYTINKKSFCYRHTDKNKLHLVYLIKQFKKLGVDSLKIYKDKKGYYHFSTRYYREFEYFRNKWYKEEGKTIPKNLIISSEMLKLWYIGDGSFDNKSKSQKIRICNDWKVPNRKRLISELKRIGIKISVYNDGFYIKKESWNVFFNYMLSDNKEISPCYKYKFPKEVF